MDLNLDKRETPNVFIWILVLLFLFFFLKRREMERRSFTYAVNSLKFEDLDWPFGHV